MWRHKLLATTGVLLLLLAPRGLAATIRVPQDHPTISAAIDAAQPSDFIEIAKGTYKESVVIDVLRLTLVAKGKVIIDPGSSLVPAIHVKSGYDVQLIGLQVRNIAVGILLESSTHCDVIDCRVSVHSTAIAVTGSHNTITGCRLSSIFKENPTIRVVGAENTIEYNDVHGHVRVEGADNVLGSNTVKDLVFADGFIVFGSGNLLSDNTVLDPFSSGIFAVGDANVVVGNRVARAHHGIQTSGKACVVYGNDVSRCSTEGIYVEGSECVVSFNKVRKGGLWDLTVLGTGMLVYANDVKSTKRG